MTKKRPSLAGRDSFHVLDPTGTELAVKGAPSHALTTAQGIAERSPVPVVLTVRRRSLFGPAVEIYHVTRTEDGTVFTNANLED